MMKCPIAAPSVATATPGTTGFCFSASSERLRATANGRKTGDGRSSVVENGRMSVAGEQHGNGGQVFEPRDAGFEFLDPHVRRDLRCVGFCFGGAFCARGGSGFVGHDLPGLS